MCGFQALGGKGRAEFLQWHSSISQMQEGGRTEPEVRDCKTRQSHKNLANLVLLPAQTLLTDLYVLLEIVLRLFHRVWSSSPPDLPLFKT